jgi:endonuclease YncB( thermonuclease family)
MRWSLWLSMVTVGLLLLVGLPRAYAAEAFPSCASAQSTSFQAVGVRDGVTIVTKEGELVRLAGVVVPGSLDGDEPAAERARMTLLARIQGEQIFVRGGSRDRYGAINGEVLAGNVWLQAEQVKAGNARVAAHPDAAGCRAALLKFEQEARLVGHGNWSNPRFAIHGPNDMAELTAAEGRFMLVEGFVRRIGESGKRIYLDFGVKFNEDFSVIVPADANKAFTNAGIDLRSLAGVRLRVRGVVSIQGGPAIVVRDPSALEILKADGA